MSQQVDVEENLAAMDDKLRELQHELSVLTTAPEAEGSLPPAREAPPPRPEITTTSPGDRNDLPLAAAAADQARAIIADAQAEATRIVGDAAQRVTGLTAQIDDLQRLRDELERSARALVDEYAAALSHVGQEPASQVAPMERPQLADDPPAPMERPQLADDPAREAPRSPVHPPLW